MGLNRPVRQSADTIAYFG